MKTLSLALLCLVFVGCAASNGGGHVVGNPMMPPEYSEEKVAPCECGVPNQPADCGCANPKAKKSKRR